MTHTRARKRLKMPCKGCGAPISWGRWLLLGTCKTCLTDPWDVG